METVSELTLHDSIIEARKHFKHIRKYAINPHLKSRYAKLDDVIDAMTEALSMFGINVMQTPKKVDGEWVMSTTITKGQEKIEEYFPILIGQGNNPMQQFGAACSYARRYHLIALFFSAAEDDDGHGAGTGAPSYGSQSAWNSGTQSKKPSSPSFELTDDILGDVKRLLPLTNRNEEKMIAWIRENVEGMEDIQSLDEVPSEILDDLRKKLYRSIGVKA
jgi:hypothetical protein